MGHFGVGSTRESAGCYEHDMSPDDPYAIRPDPLKESQAILSGIDPTRALEAIVGWLLESGLPADKLRVMVGKLR